MSPEILQKTLKKAFWVSRKSLLSSISRAGFGFVLCCACFIRVSKLEMLGASLTLCLPQVAPEKLPEPGGFRSLPGKGCPSLERRRSTAGLAKPLWLLEREAEGVQLLHSQWTVHMSLQYAKLEFVGRDLLQCQGCPACLSLPGPAGSHPALLLLWPLPWGLPM